MSYWQSLKHNFINIIKDHEYYNKVFNFLINYENNVLLYGHHGFPTDIFIEEVIKHKFDIRVVHKKECMFGKDVLYQYNQHFLEIDLIHPAMTKDLSQLSKFILSIVKNKNINDNKHFIIIKHIDILNHDEFSSFRIILERFSNNVYFLCTTHKLDKIDVPVKSRFALFRMPLFNHKDILNIFKVYLKHQVNEHLIAEKTRNIIKAIFIAHVESTNPELITKEFCTLNFPPLYEFYNKKHTLDDIRQFSYKCFQYNISISEIVADMIKILPNKKKLKAIQIGTELDHAFTNTNNSLETIYIETLLCQILL